MIGWNTNKIVVLSFLVHVQLFSLIVQTYVLLSSMTSSLFTLLVTEVGLRELCFAGGRLSNLLVGVGLVESGGTCALHVCLIGGGVVSVTCGTCVSFVRAMQRAHVKHT
jgi:hypothetical protein